MWGRVQSLVLLGLALMKTLLLRLGGASNNVERFNQVYSPDGVLSMSEAEARVLGRASPCTGCGRCDLQQGPRVLDSKVGYRGMTAFVLGGTRSLTDSREVARLISEVPESDFEDAQR